MGNSVSRKDHCLFGKTGVEEASNESRRGRLPRLNPNS
jgi:hypothetical protein